MDDSDLRSDALISSISEAVFTVLKADRFFEDLDDRFCPIDSKEKSCRCDGSFSVSSQILAESGMDVNAIEDVLAVLHSRGACCDCEVLYNVVGNSRLKSKCWKARHGQISGTRLFTQEI